MDFWRGRTLFSDQSEKKTDVVEKEKEGMYFISRRMVNGRGVMANYTIRQIITLKQLGKTNILDEIGRFQFLVHLLQ